MGRAIAGAVACPLPIIDRLRGATRRGVVLRQEFGLRLDDLREVCLHGLGNPLVILLTHTPEQRLVGCFLNESVLKAIGGLGEYSALVDELRLHKLSQTLLQRCLVQRGDGLEQLIGKGPDGP